MRIVLNTFGSFGDIHPYMALALELQARGHAAVVATMEVYREKIDAAMQGSRPTRVNLKQPLTVVLFYDTVHVNSESVVFFVDDIYGHDRALDAALASGYPYPVKG